MKFSAAALVFIMPALALAKPVHPSVGLPSLGLPTLGLPGLGQPTPVVPTPSSVVPTPASSVPVTLPTSRIVLPIPESALPTAALAARWADGDPCPVSPLQCCESSYAVSRLLPPVAFSRCSSTVSDDSG